MNYTKAIIAIFVCLIVLLLLFLIIYVCKKKKEYFTCDPQNSKNEIDHIKEQSGAYVNPFTNAPSMKNNISKITNLTAPNFSEPLLYSQSNITNSLKDMYRLFYNLPMNHISEMSLFNIFGRQSYMPLQDELNDTVKKASKVKQNMTQNKNLNASDKKNSKI